MIAERYAPARRKDALIGWSMTKARSTPSSD
jgi:hypothetical protein